MPFVAPLVGCKGKTEPQAWVSRDGGGELGRRVRAGAVAGVAHHVFRSALLAQDVGLVVMTPPGYAGGTARHPTVYMFPGIGGDEWSYLLEAGEGPALKALFDDPVQAPIVVLCNSASTGGHGVAERVLSEEVVAFVDRTYRTTDARSLEGFSLGGVTALTLLFRRPELYRRAVAASSACYLIDSCAALRRELAARANPSFASRVLLSIGARESAQNAAVNEELARRMGSSVIRIPDAEHNWGAQLQTSIEGELFANRVASFHRAGLAAD